VLFVYDFDLCRNNNRQTNKQIRYQHPHNARILASPLRQLALKVLTRKLPLNYCYYCMCCKCRACYTCYTAPAPCCLIELLLLILLLLLLLLPLLLLPHCTANDMVVVLKLRDSSWRHRARGLVSLGFPVPCKEGSPNK